MCSIQIHSGPAIAPEASVPRPWIDWDAGIVHWAQEHEKSGKEGVIKWQLLLESPWVLPKRNISPLGIGNAPTLPPADTGGTAMLSLLFAVFVARSSYPNEQYQLSHPDSSKSLAIRWYFKSYTACFVRLILMPLLYQLVIHFGKIFYFACGELLSSRQQADEYSLYRTP
jgi:hypothetical protein